MYRAKSNRLSANRVFGMDNRELLTEDKVFQHQVAMGTKDPKDGSKPEAKQVEHGGKVTARRPLSSFRCC